jgi:creatinine amidohydrolase
MKQTVYMEEMDAFTYREKIAKDAIVFIPVGALEQHGSHMAMCVDAALTKSMAGATAEAIVRDSEGAVEALVCAPINFGYRSQQRSGGGFHLTGTTSLTGTTLIYLSRDICYNLIEDGARRIVFMNGHYENYQFVFEGAQLALEKAKAEGIKDVKVQLMSYWDFVDDETIDRLYPEGFTGWDLEHAGVMETSLMLLFYPDLVDMDRIDAGLYCDLPAVMPNYDVLPVISGYTPPSGCLSHPGESTREKGIILRDVAVKNMVKAISNEFYKTPAYDFSMN